MRRGPTEKGLRYACLVGAIGVMAAATQALVQVPDSLTLPVFTDITRQAGLKMKIINGNDPTEYLMDVNWQGACFIDYNDDGYQDLFLVNGSSRSLQATGQAPHDYLLRNNGDGTFTDVTAAA